MPVNGLDLIQYCAVSLPVIAILLVAMAMIYERLKQLIKRPERKRRRRRRSGPLRTPRLHNSD